MAPPAEPDLVVVIDIERPVDEVRAWWTEMPTDYRAEDPREQPFRIVTTYRDDERWEIDTYWRLPGLRNLRVPETFRFRDDGWDVEARAPMGITQLDAFTLTPTETGTRVTIRARIVRRNPIGFLTVPLYRAYGRKHFGRMWRGAGKLCARDAPRLAVP